MLSCLYLCDVWVLCGMCVQDDKKVLELNETGQLQRKLIGFEVRTTQHTHLVPCFSMQQVMHLSYVHTSQNSCKRVAVCHTVHLFILCTAED